MAAIPQIPASQYLRMSTERQEYSSSDRGYRDFCTGHEIRAGQTIHETNKQLLQELRSLLAVKGKISTS